MSEKAEREEAKARIEAAYRVRFPKAQANPQKREKRWDGTARAWIDRPQCFLVRRTPGAGGFPLATAFGQTWAAAADDAIAKLPEIIARHDEYAARTAREAAEAEARGLAIREFPNAVAVIRDMLAEMGGRPKSCGHEFTCVCAPDKARALLDRIGQP